MWPGHTGVLLWDEDSGAGWGLLLLQHPGVSKHCAERWGHQGSMEWHGIGWDGDNSGYSIPGEQVSCGGMGRDGDYSWCSIPG